MPTTFCIPICKNYIFLSKKAVGRSTVFELLSIDEDESKPFSALSIITPAINKKNINVQLVNILMPNFGKGKEQLSIYFVECNFENTASLLSEKNWMFVPALLENYQQHEIFLSPLVLEVLNVINNHNTENAVKLASLRLQTFHLYQYTPHIKLFPVSSHTLQPFTTTNIIVIESDGECLLIDPGASPDGEEDLLKLLDLLPSPPKIFITHHHLDHIEALPLLESKFGESAVMIAHPNTLNRINNCPILKRQPVVTDNNQSITHLRVGTVDLQVLYTPGHTDGHLAIFEPKSRTLIAGDHVVGYGSSVLDLECGDMLQYFTSTHQMISLEPLLVIPAHGPPCYSPVQLLQDYITHRQSREDSILEAYNSGRTTPDAIVEVVYQEIPPALWQWAKRNIVLHLRKLEKEGKIPLSQ